MIEYVIDTETTGLDREDRVIEIAAVELRDRLPTGREFHAYVATTRPINKEAQAVHGITAEFLEGHPTFAGVVNPFLSFVGDGPLVAHNASFDMRMIAAEIARVRRFGAHGARLFLKTPVIDTLALARKRQPGKPASLSALAKRFKVNIARERHGALIDARICAAVYLHLTGGRQRSLDIPDAQADIAPPIRPFRPPRPHAPTEEESALHAALVEQLNRHRNWPCLWTLEGASG